MGTTHVGRTLFSDAVDLRKRPPHTNTPKRKRPPTFLLMAFIYAGDDRSLS